MGGVSPPKISENIQEIVIVGNLRFEFVCNSRFYNIGMWLVYYKVDVVFQPRNIRKN